MRRTLVSMLVAGSIALAATGTGSADEAQLNVGFGVRMITPVGTYPDMESWDFAMSEHEVWGEAFTDANGNGYYDPPSADLGEEDELGDEEFFQGEPFTDDLRNSEIDPLSTGKWDGVWTNAGFGGRGALGKLDDTWARAIVLQIGDDTVALVSIDVVGFFYEEIERIRAELDAAHPGHGIDEVVVSSTHTHEGPDTMGLWGNPLGTDGKFPLYQAFIRSQVVQAIADGLGALEPARLKAATAFHLPVAETEGGAYDIRDSRPPVVIDPWVQAAQFVRPDSSVIGTLVNWSNHPEALWSRNRYVSSDFPHGTRTRLEAEWPGSTAVYFSGSVGGLMTPGDQPDRYVEIGENVAEVAIGALATAPLEDPSELAHASKEFFLPGDNYSLRALNAIGVFDKPTYTAGIETGYLGDTFKTQMVSVGVGSVRFQSVPGELFPELEIGGYGREDCPAADTGRPHEPVIAEQYAEEHLFTLGLAQDELGYIVPGYDFWIFGAPDGVLQSAGATEESAPRPLIHVGVEEATDPCGEDHYEETVSASSVMAPVVACTAAELAGNDPWNRTDELAYSACSEANTTTLPQGLHLP